MIRRLKLGLPALIFVAAALLTAVIPISAETGAQSKPRLTDLSPEEEAYIAAHGTLKIGYVQDLAPLSFTDENGELAGISRYIFDRVGELCGIDFEYVPLPSGDVTYDYLLENGLDLVSNVDYNEENKHARGILMSEPYLSSKKVVVAKDNLEFRYDANLSIAISSGSQTIRKVLSESYPNFEIVNYPSISDCFDAVNSGDADLLMLNQYVVEYRIAKPIYEKLKVIPVIGLEDRLCFSAVVAIGDGEGASANEGQTLIDLIDKAISSISEDEVGSYTIQAIMENQYRYTFSDFLYRYRLAARVFAVSAVIIVVLTAVLVRQHVRIAETKADEKVKSRFLSTMSHEIRTPLNGLLGLNYLMSQKLDDSEKLKNYLSQSTLTANYLLSLVNDMLDMSSLQSQEAALESKPLDLSLVIDTVDSIAKNSMAEKSLRYELDSELSCSCILGDAIRIQQVLLNLLDNARKFTPRGGSIKLTVRQKILDSGKILTEASVADTGRGMSDEFQKHIFETFAQELDTVSKGNQGTGLGLPICRRLANLMDGDITFVSQKDHGSTFTFTFESSPAEMPPQDETESAHASPDGDGRRPRILVAEDNELNGEIIMELLHEDGFEAELAENGKIAFSMFKDSAPWTYGVILMDLLMPEMDGFETSRAIRALDRDDAKSVRIFACTANSSLEDRDKAFASGMDDFITKPVDIDELLRKIKEN